MNKSLIIHAKEVQQAQIDLDLDAAGEIQKTLLPHDVPDIKSIQMKWSFEPCQQVGGDIFHLYEEDPSQISAYLLDVCGHGVSAFLIAVTAKQFLGNVHGQALMRGYSMQPAEILNKLEKEFPFDRFQKKMCTTKFFFRKLDALT